jgi:hypothetical protein
MYATIMILSVFAFVSHSYMYIEENQHNIQKLHLSPGAFTHQLDAAKSFASHAPNLYSPF